MSQELAGAMLVQSPIKGYDPDVSEIRHWIISRS